MELKDFVKHSILDIAKGIKEANEEALEGDIGLIVNPCPIYFRSAGHVEYAPGGKKDGRTKHVEMIKFDVAVTTSGSATAEGGGGINVAGIKLGASGEVTDEKENGSRIKFEIPVVMPTIL